MNCRSRIQATEAVRVSDPELSDSVSYRANTSFDIKPFGSRGLCR